MHGVAFSVASIYPALNNLLFGPQDEAPTLIVSV